MMPAAVLQGLSFNRQSTMSLFAVPGQAFEKKSLTNDFAPV